MVHFAHTLKRRVYNESVGVILLFRGTTSGGVSSRGSAALSCSRQLAIECADKPMAVVTAAVLRDRME